MNGEYRILYKVAALEFLNNISLDGSFNDNKLPTLTSKVKSLKDISEEHKTATDGNFVVLPGKSKMNISEQTSSVNKLLTKRMFESFCSRKRRTTSSSSMSSLSDEKGNGLKSKLNKQRLVLVSPNHKTPFTIYSILPFKKRKKLSKTEGQVLEKPEINRPRLISGNSGSTQDSIMGFGLIQIPMEEDTSYQHLLKPIIYIEEKKNVLIILNKLSTPDYSLPLEVQRNARYEGQAKPSKSQEVSRYDPNLLDDPEMINSRRKVVLHLPSYLTTIINYVRPIDMKTDINEQFRQKFPEIKLTLSKLRSLKGNILSVAKKSGIDLWTVANAFVYFETLVIKNLITKSNRKLCCAAALILSAKINDIRGSEMTTTVQELENTFRIHRREIFQYELYVFVALEFGLLSCDKTVNVHYKRLMRSF